MPHEKADARDHAQTMVKLELRRYSRRILQTVEDHISVSYDEITARGETFDPVAVAESALEAARERYIAGELPAADAEAEAAE
jgi:hypothetical protein